MNIWKIMSIFRFFIHLAKRSPKVQASVIGALIAGDSTAFVFGELASLF
jgi:hypothetical protein